MTAWRAPFLFILCTLVLGGCDQLQPKQTAPPKVDPEACAAYTKKLCAEAGEDTPKCASLTQTLAMLPPAACAAGMTDIAFTKAKLAETGKKCEELITKLCAELGEKTATCEMVQTQTKSFPPERCEMMLSKFPEVLADLKKMEARNAPLPAEKLAALTAGDLPSFGPADAKVTIVAFSDFECPFCSRAATATHAIREQYGDKVRFVFRQFPLSFHKLAHGAAQASLAAHAQGKFWELHDAMFEGERKLDRESLEAAAAKAGMDVARFKKDLDDKTFAATVDADLKLGADVGVDGTPTMFINGKRATNPTDATAIAKEIDAALSSS